MRMLLAFILVSLASPSFAKEEPSCLPTHIQTKNEKRSFKLELATTPEARTQGLMYRKTMGTCDGMAFFFPETSPQKFWMRNTHLPLDILFVDEAGSIVYIGHGKPLSLETVGPEQPILTVIELEHGRAAKEGIHVGDKVRYEIATSPQLLAR